MGVDPYNLTSALNGVVAQRLIRLGCPRCAELVAVPPVLRGKYLGLRHVEQASRGRGCGDCRGTGYRGRRAIAEVLRIDDSVREGILNRESPRSLRARAVAAGMVTLADRAAELVAEQRTSLEELERVADAG
jgi:general secretion pathway protein E